MLLAIDAGNTNIVFAVFDGAVLRGQWRIATDARRTADEYGVWLLQLMARAGLKPENIDGAIISSVVPQVLFALKTLCAAFFDTPLLVVGESVPPRIAVEVDRPGDVGADRLVNARAAWDRHQTPLVIIDFGTATTFDVVNAAGAYIGGVIAPGIHLSLDALQKAAAKLPNVAISNPQKVIGTSTVSAMQSGIYYGYLGLIEGIVRRIIEEHGAPMTVIATGGLAPLFAKGTPIIQHLEPDLTLSGLQALWQAHISAGNHH